MHPLNDVFPDHEEDEEKSPFPMTSWFRFLATLAGRIHEYKQQLVKTSILGGIFASLWIFVLEILLGFFALPIYLFYDTAGNRPSFFNQDGCAYSLYRLRKRATVSVIVPIVLVIIAYFTLFSGVQAATITWDGGGPDSNWSTALNWSTDTVPSSTDIVVFDGTSVTNATIDSGFHGTVAGVQIGAAYTGTITQARPLIVNGAFTKANGTFLGNSDILDFNGVFTQTGGIFQASSATTSFSTHFRPTGGTYLHNNGTTLFDGTGDTAINFATSTASTFSLYNVVVDRQLVSDGLQYEDASDSAARIFVLGSLQLNRGTLRNPIVSGVTTYILLESYGTVSFGQNWAGGGGVLRVAGPGQTIELPPNGNINRVDLFTATTTLNFNGTGTTTVNALGINGGIINQNNAHISTGSLTAFGATSRFNGGPGNFVAESIEAYNGAQFFFGTGRVQAGSTVRLGGTAGSYIDFSLVSGLFLRRFQSNAAITAFGVSTNATVILPPIPVYIDFSTTSIVGTLSATNTTLIFDRNASQGFLSSHEITLAGLTKIATSTQYFTLSPGVTTTIIGPMVLQGTSSTTLLRVRSSVAGSQALINPTGSRSVSFLEVVDNRNLHETLIDATGQYTIDGGNVDGWFGMIDITNPTPPGPLTEGDHGGTYATLLFGTPSVEVNFSDYSIYYRSGTSTPTIFDTALTSSTVIALRSRTYAGATSTQLTGLLPSEQYTANIWAYDEYGNTSSSTAPITFRLDPNPPGNVTVSEVRTDEITVTWTSNGNLPSTLFYIENVNDSAQNSGWTSDTFFTFTNLPPQTAQTFRVRSQDVFGGVSDWVVVGDTTQTQGGAGIFTPPPSPSPTSGPTGGATSNPAAVSINLDEVTTTDPNVFLFLTSGDAVDVAIAHEPTFFNAPFVTFSPVFEWLLSPGLGTKTVYVRFRTASGATQDASDTIELIGTGDEAVEEESEEPEEEAPTDTGPQCGNGFLEQGEVCDDGNTMNGDLCSSMCEVESPTSPGPTPGLPPPSNPPATTPPPAASSPNPSPSSSVVPPPQSQNSSGSGSSGGGATPPVAPEPPSAPPEIVSGELITNPIPEDIFSPVIVEEETSVSVETPTDDVSAIVSRVPVVTQLPENVRTPLLDTIRLVEDAITSPSVERAASDVVAPVATTLTALATLPSLWTTVLPLLRLLFLQPLLVLGLRRKQVWGEVYHSLTRVPIDLATIRLIDTTTGRTVQSRVTDQRGRYLFLPKAGSYRLEVVKEGFRFPTTVTQNSGAGNEIYQGEVIVHETDGIPIALSIPLDLVEQPVQHHRSYTRPLRRLQTMVAAAGVVTTGAALIIAPSYETGGLLMVHVLLIGAMKRFVRPKNPKRFGVVLDEETDTPIAQAVVRLYNATYHKLVETQVTNSLGQYAFLVGQGTYYVTIDRPGYQKFKSEEVVFTDTDKTFLNGNFIVSRVDTFDHVTVNFVPRS